MGGKTRERKSLKHLLAAQGDQGSTERSKAASSALPVCAGSGEAVVIQITAQPGSVCLGLLEEAGSPGAAGCLLQTEMAAWGTRPHTQGSLLGLPWTPSSLGPNSPQEGRPSPLPAPSSVSPRAFAKFPAWQNFLPTVLQGKLQQIFSVSQPWEGDRRTKGIQSRAGSCSEGTHSPCSSLSAPSP